MINTLRNHWQTLRESLWLVPFTLVFGAALLALFLTRGNVGFSATTASPPWWLFAGDVDSARGLMGSLVSGMLTMISLLVSMTMVVLSVSAGQHGPRIITNFMRDTQIQVTLGLFAATALFCLLVLWSINENTDAGQLPKFAISTAGLLVILCLLALILYVHKVARSIIVDTIVERIEQTLAGAIRAGMGGNGRTAANDHAPQLGKFDIGLKKAGYLQIVHTRTLERLAEAHDWHVRVLVRPGQFLLENGQHVAIYAGVQPDGQQIRALRGAFDIGPDRTPTQDVEYAVRLLVEIALRALSAGMNDPFTAIGIIDRLSAAVEQAGQTLERRKNSTRRQNGTPGCPVTMPQSDFEGLCDAAFNQIRQAAATNPGVLIALAATYDKLMDALPSTDQRAIIAIHARRLDRLAGKALGDPDDLADFKAALGRAAPSGTERQPAID